MCKVRQPPDIPGAVLFLYELLNYQRVALQGQTE